MWETVCYVLLVCFLLSSLLTAIARARAARERWRWAPMVFAIALMEIAFHKAMDYFVGLLFVSLMLVGLIAHLIQRSRFRPPFVRISRFGFGNAVFATFVLAVAVFSIWLGLYAPSRVPDVIAFSIAALCFPVIMITLKERTEICGAGVWHHGELHTWDDFESFFWTRKDKKSPVVALKRAGTKPDQLWDSLRLTVPPENVEAAEQLLSANLKDITPSTAGPLGETNVGNRSLRADRLSLLVVFVRQILRSRMGLAFALAFCLIVDMGYFFGLFFCVVVSAQLIAYPIHRSRIEPSFVRVNDVGLGKAALVILFAGFTVLFIFIGLHPSRSWPGILPFVMAALCVAFVVIILCERPKIYGNGVWDGQRLLTWDEFDSFLWTADDKRAVVRLRFAGKKSDTFLGDTFWNSLQFAIPLESREAAKQLLEANLSNESGRRWALEED
jgi:hypothetical protein